MGIKIKGTGSSLPERIVTNNDISELVETSDAWIRERTGIRERHVSTGETAADLAVMAAQKALADANKNGEDVDLIIVASCSAEMALPCVACQVQARIGSMNAVAFDLNAACAGFLFALNTASTYLESGIYKNALIIGTEVLSKIVDWTDRGTCILFGDGAGAVYIEKDDTKPMSFLQQSNGTKGDVLKCGQRENKNAFYNGEMESKFVSMDGKEVFRFATRQVPQVISELLVKEEVEPENVDYYILHQANIRIIEGVAKRLKLDLEKFPANVERVGNTSSASIPILLDEVRKEGKIKEGMQIVMAGFGAGLTYGACFVKL